MDIKEAIDLIFDGNCLLFTGAGASITATNLKDEHLKPAVELTEMLYDECGITADGNLESAVDEYLDVFGEQKLITLLKEQYSVKSIEEEHIILGSLNWRRIYTTNYDDVLETSYRKNCKILTPVTLANKPYHFKDKSHVCIHLNGYIDALTPETLNNEFKLSDVSYLTNDFRDNEWCSLFRQDLVIANAIFFVGFSLKYDLDLKRIIYSTPELREKCFFIVREKEDSTTLKAISKFGTALSIGSQAFSDLIKARKATYVPRIQINLKPLCFTQPIFHNTTPDIKDRDFFKLLVEGEVNEQVLEYSIFSPSQFPYYVFREKIQLVLESIKKGKKDIIITSDLGNGKTLFVQGLAFLLKKEGYNVYSFKKYFATLSRELDEICTKTQKAVIILENYGHYFEILKELKNLRSDLVLIVTERSLINDSIINKYEEYITGDYDIIDVNIMSDNEMLDFINLIDKYGLWGDYASFSVDRKISMISIEFRRNIRLLLLKLLESPNIIGKFNEVISTIQEKKNFYEAITLILISKVFGFNLFLDDLIYALDAEVLNKPSFQTNSSVREFVNFDQSTITVKSSILAEVILTRVVNSRGIVDTLIKLVKRLDSRRSDKNFKNILREILSFSNLRRILSKDTAEYKYNILRFFEEIKNTNYASKNPHYWLQYAIARLEEREYSIADSYFQTAYSYARKIDKFDTYQIDYHFARHIIENEIFNGSKETCMEQFLKAHKIISNPNTQKETKYYPFRIAQKYYPFYEKYFSSLSRQDKIIFIRSCEEMITRADAYVRRTETHRIRPEVKIAKSLLLEIIEKEQV
jgi:hypothetical protein